VVNPFNGEGIAHAIESGELAATAIAEAHYRGAGTPSAERALESYPVQLKAALGGYYSLGRAFVKLIGKPQVMRACTNYGLPHRTLMKFVLKLMANLTDSSDGDAMDKVINSLARIAPAA
jgi:menaquinone-9 beta-reductase